MPAEAQMEHPPTALLVGDVTRLLAARTDQAAEAGWRFHQVPDVYAAAARLLRPDRPKPDVVLVMVESLRGDELRFFDFLARRWPALPAAALYGVSAEDRRLQACRVRGVTVVAADGLVAWLAQLRPAVQDLSEQAPPATADAPVTNAPEIAPPDSPSPAAPARGPVTFDEHAALAGVEVTLELPDELADLPDLDDTQASLVQHGQYDAEDLPEEVDEVDEEEEYSDLSDAAAEQDLVESEGLAPQEPDPEPDHLAQNLPDYVPLTPWSNVPRAARRRKSVAPPESPPAVPPAPEPPVSPSASVAADIPDPRPAAPGPQPLVPPAPLRSWEHGLLTPDELRALLQDPDESAGQQEARP